MMQEGSKTKSLEKRVEDLKYYDRVGDVRKLLYDLTKEPRWQDNMYWSTFVKEIRNKKIQEFLDGKDLKNSQEWPAYVDEAAERFGAWVEAQRHWYNGAWVKHKTLRRWQAHQALNSLKSDPPPPPGSSRLYADAALQQGSCEIKTTSRKFYDPVKDIT